ncbi:hypothetical protein DdX_05986 [Ditylenchus destructor]|uniref:Uncharacterized protein n=1 Tax=Ditylenchus destructor TaxID=166010 RepID=A0AAD4NBI6_9BILA|nr:hypothetical protein DdX_05986 [Ditylenchus destructor]
MQYNGGNGGNGAPRIPPNIANNWMIVQEDPSSSHVTSVVLHTPSSPSDIADSPPVRGRRESLNFFGSQSRKDSSMSYTPMVRSSSSRMDYLGMSPPASLMTRRRSMRATMLEMETGELVLPPRKPSILHQTAPMASIIFPGPIAAAVAIAAPKKYTPLRIDLMAGNAQPPMGSRLKNERDTGKSDVGASEPPDPSDVLAAVIGGIDDNAGGNEAFSPLNEQASSSSGSNESGEDKSKQGPFGGFRGPNGGHLGHGPVMGSGGAIQFWEKLRKWRQNGGSGGREPLGSPHGIRSPFEQSSDSSADDEENPLFSQFGDGIFGSGRAGNGFRPHGQHGMGGQFESGSLNQGPHILPAGFGDFGQHGHNGHHIGAGQLQKNWWMPNDPFDSVGGGFNTGFGGGFPQMNPFGEQQTFGHNLWAGMGGMPMGGARLSPYGAQMPYPGMPVQSSFGMPLPYGYRFHKDGSQPRRHGHEGLSGGATDGFRQGQAQFAAQ